MEKDLEPSSSPPNCSKDYWELLPLPLSINWPSLVTSQVEVQKIYLKMYLVSCTDTHRDTTDSANHRMVKSTKTWISWERNIIFPQNEKILNLHLRWHIMRSYHFEAEVTFKGYLCYKTIFCHKVALDTQLMNFFIWNKNNVLFSRFCVFVFLRNS